MVCPGLGTKPSSVRRPEAGHAGGGVVPGGVAAITSYSQRSGGVMVIDCAVNSSSKYRVSISDVTWGLKGGMSCKGKGPLTLCPGNVTPSPFKEKSGWLAGWHPLSPYYLLLNHILPVDASKEPVLHHLLGIFLATSEPVSTAKTITSSH